MTELFNKSEGFHQRICRFYFGLDPDFPLPEGVEILQPYANEMVQQVVREYYGRYYTGNQPRIYMIGINPGRFGGGVTGIPFTDPVQLTGLGIGHDFQLKRELSSTFMYSMIEAYGGLELFSRDFFLTAISPIGFTKSGKNYNYYDDPQLETAARQWMLNTMEQQLEAGADRRVAVCLGEGSNYQYLSRLNSRQGWFETIRPLPHPRWIMQYNRKQLPQMTERYIQLLKSLING